MDLETGVIVLRVVLSPKDQEAKIKKRQYSIVVTSRIMGLLLV